jgi:hypothetical protein
MTGHEDDTALGPAPKPGKVERHAAWHAAWRALGRPESGRDEAGMSDGQLLVRVRAYQGEEAWAPAYVADEMEGTSKKATKHRQEAILLAARAESVPRADQSELRRQADEAAAYADVLDQRVRDPTAADAARAQWYVHTAETRAAADRARAELADRGVDPDEPADAISVQDWLPAHVAHSRDDDAHRLVRSEADFADNRTEALSQLEPVPVDAAETGVPDIREVAASERARPIHGQEGRPRVATGEEAGAAVERAQRALLELRARAALDKRATQETGHIDLAWRAHRHREAADTAAIEQVVE